MNLASLIPHEICAAEKFTHVKIGKSSALIWFSTFPRLTRAKAEGKGESNRIEHVTRKRRRRMRKKKKRMKTTKRKRK